MTDLHKAVFLSYASEDAAAALQICTALRGAGIEVWFDQSELRGEDQESQRAWDELIAKHGQDSAYEIGEAYAWRGEKEKAIEWLGRAVDQHDGGWSASSYDPLLAPLRSDPRYSALVAKMQLPH
jgi:TIR domain